MGAPKVRKNPIAKAPRVRKKTSIPPSKAHLRKASKILKIDPDKFLQDFNILSVQRSLKIIGIFSRLSKRDQKKEYMKFIPYTWQLLNMRMASEIFLELKKILNNHISKKSRNKIINK